MKTLKVDVYQKKRLSDSKMNDGLLQVHFEHNHWLEEFHVTGVFCLFMDLNFESCCEIETMDV